MCYELSQVPLIIIALFNPNLRQEENTLAMKAQPNFCSFELEQPNHHSSSMGLLFQASAF